jgi:hypothetical protein
LESRSTIGPQLLHPNVRSASASSFLGVPQAEQILVEANQRSHVTNSPPNQSALYVS